MSGQSEARLSTRLGEICLHEYAHTCCFRGGPGSLILAIIRLKLTLIPKKCLTGPWKLHIIIWSMTGPDKEDPKSKALRDQGALHPHPERVMDEQFHAHEFFDPRDRVQVKYEMLCRHRIDGQSIKKVAASFGVSRQGYYKTDAAFKARGLAGLIPRRPGPKGAHKFNDEILDFIVEWRAGATGQAGENVVEAVQRRFGVALHPRSIDRALEACKKKRRAKRRAP